MKRVVCLLSAFLSVLLVACGPTTVSYKLTFNVAEESTRHDLTMRSLKVIERRLGNLGATLTDQHIQNENGEVQVRIETDDKAAVTLLTEQLTEPFKLRIMRETPEETADLVVQGHGGFSEVGITEKDMVWAEAAEDLSGKGVVRLVFTTEGREKMSKLFKESMGKSIGIFVRDRLVSKLKVQADEITDSIVIRDIPSAEMGRVFVDDLNVGLHVVFTPAS